MNSYDLENYLSKIVIEECLKELTEQEREVLLLYYWWGYRDVEIGKMLGESQQIINYRRNKALKKIRNTLLEDLSPSCNCLKY